MHIIVRSLSLVSVALLFAGIAIGCAKHTNSSATVRIEAVSFGRVIGIATVDVRRGSEARFASGALVGSVRFDGGLITRGAVTAHYSVNGLSTSGEVTAPAGLSEHAVRKHPDGREIRLTVTRLERNS